MSETPNVTTLSKDILCHMLKFFKINNVPLIHIHALRNIYNSSKSIRRFMSREQLLTIERWKKIIYLQMKFTTKRNSTLLHDYKYIGTSYFRCTVCFCKHPYMDKSPHQRYRCPLSAKFCKDHVGGTKLYPACMFHIDKSGLTSKCILCK